MLNSYFIRETLPAAAPKRGTHPLGRPAPLFLAAALCAAAALYPAAPAKAAEIDYQSLREDPVDTVFRRILTQEVPGWDDAPGYDVKIDADMQALKWPLKEGRIAGLFNLRAAKGKRRHKGVDLLAPRGTAIYAALDGLVEVVASGGKGWHGYGKVVFINHGDKFWTLYSHCDTTSVKIGQRVKQGEQIATVGRTGRASGFHLHFELRDANGSPVDPMRFLPKEGALPAINPAKK